MKHGGFPGVVYPEAPLIFRGLEGRGYRELSLSRRGAVLLRVVIKS